MVDCNRSDRFSHELLLHETDDELVEGTRDFVERGLGSGGRVLAHGTRDRVALLRRVLGTRTGLEYGLTEELYRKPMSTLFGYQQKLAESPCPAELWSTGSLPPGRDVEEQAAWARYESLVNEALGAYPFHALCTYDVRVLPADVVTAARASHPVVQAGPGQGPSTEYLDPTAFLACPMAQVPRPPGSAPSLVLMVEVLEELEDVRRRVMALARAASALSLQSLDDLLVVVTELSANGLVHGAPPVWLRVWADVTLVTCQVVDSGTGALDPLAGFRYPGESGPMGLWMARQLVDDLFIGDAPGGGCSVLFTKT